jgi:hypothetical protein
MSDSSMAAIPFEVEQIFTVAGHGAVVLARPLQEPHEFSLTAEAALDGHPLRPVLEVPRIIRPEDGPRSDLFAFTLLQAEDLAYFAVGQRVVLTP